MTCRVCVLVIAGVLSAYVNATEQGATSRDADVVLHSGKIAVVADAFSMHQAIAVARIDMTIVAGKVLYERKPD